MTFLLPVTRRSFDFASSLLQVIANIPSTCIQFLIASKSRDLERHLRLRFPSVLASQPIPDWSDRNELQEALEQCSGVIFAASGHGNDIIDLNSHSIDEWLQCEQSLASAVSKAHRIVKLSWTEGFISETSPSAAGRANWMLENKLREKFAQCKSLSVLRVPMGMDAFLQGRLFHLICGRTLSISVKRGKIAFVHPLDVAESLSAILQKKSDEMKDVYELTGPEALTFSDVAKIISEGIRDKITYSYFPLWAVQPARWVHGVPGDVIEEELAVMRALEAGAQQQVNSNLMETLLGHKPRTFQEFVAENATGWPRTDPI